MSDWVTVFSSIATGGGTLVLAVATFSSVKSANRSARVAERSLLAGQRPVLIPSRDDDPPEYVRFGDAVVLDVPGHGGAREVRNDNIYMALALRNGGSGLAVIHGWRAEVRPRSDSIRPDLGAFRRQTRDLYIPAGETGFWQGAIRDREDPDYEALRGGIDTGARLLVDIMYGDHEGGQRAIARFGVGLDFDPRGPDGSERVVRAEVIRYWNVDGAGPR